MPLLGNADSSREDVENFYDFWYNFQSWREYSYLDEEDKEKGQDREERRWIEKQNKIIRQKRKKEEGARIRSLVDLAYNNDPRIIKFKQEEKERKLAAKRAKQTAAQAAKAEEDRILKEIEQARLKAEEAERKRIEAIQKEKEALKRALKKERKLFRDTVKSNDYYSTEDKEKIRHMEGVDKICEVFKLLELQELNKVLPEGGRDTYLKALEETERKLEEERRALFNQKSSNGSNSNASVVKPIDKKSMWTPQNMQLLIKAVNLFPAGTVSRWEVVANFINQHATNLGEFRFTAKDVLNKTKDLQSSDFSRSELKTQANQNAFDSFEKGKKELKHVDNADISQKDAAASAAAAPATPKSSEEIESTTTTANGVQQTNGTDSKKVEPKTWTKEEQSLLEQAIKTYPLSTPDRWDRIAECIPGRTKKECLRRVKELVDRVNAKKEAINVKK